MITYKDLTEAKLNASAFKKGQKIIYANSGANGVITQVMPRGDAIEVKLAGGKTTEVKISKISATGPAYKKNYTWEIN